MILSAQSIRDLCVGCAPPLISPFYERMVMYGMTFGLDCAGYDIRSAQIKWLPPKGFVQLDAMEVFCIPNHLKMHICDKSTWMRRGVTVHNTRAEPGWHGVLRLEISNHSWRWHRITAGMPIAEVEFHVLDHPTVQPYPETGKYQNQGYGQDAILERL